MDTADKVEKVIQTETKKRGRPAKQDKPTPMGEYIAEEAQRANDRKKTNVVIEKWYTIVGRKLLLCKRKKSGTVYRVFVGSLDDPKHGAELQAFAKEQEAKGNLRTKI